MDSDFSIHIHSISTVVPASLTRRCILPLTSLDFLNRNVACMQRILFYSLDLDSLDNYDSFVDKLKGSLAETLVRFYPLAGRFTDGESEKPRINCNDAGVPFIEAAMLRKSLGDFLASPHCMDLCSELAHVESSELADAPHIAPVSVTRFKSGGLAVGVSYNHFLIDGYSFWHFMKSWSEVACGQSISLPPVHSREILISQPPVTYMSSLPRYFAIPATASMEAPIGFSNIQQRMYSFSAQFIRRLKLQAMAGSNGDIQQVSSFRVLCAHIWRCLVRARGLEESEETRFFVGVDVRKRLVPCLPDGYFGNAVCAVYAESRAGELLSPEKGTAHGVRILSQAIAGATDGNIKSLLEWCDKQGNAYFRGADYALDNNFVVVSSPKFPAYGINYGWGDPVAVRPGKLAWAGIITFFTGARGSGDIDVCICLAPEELRRMEQEPGFLSMPWTQASSPGDPQTSQVCGFQGLAPPNVFLLG
ncbi:BAHD family acyltransferase, clade I [Selaginella moellendorffii]|uniref:BAHD family acyltransferase, clade I n=1 Tax=Selaginella moellendorffii TaxID=88036 RepID=D8RTP1_SELML|nr:BAHD family acyltransferase, clade I [Selaginella moellendorffii]